MKFQDLETLKAFILWCRANKVRHFAGETVAFDLSDLAFVEDSYPTEAKDIFLDSKATFTDADPDAEPETKEEQDELLFWSAR